MKQEDKDLLLKDLCARLPYGVKLNMKGLIGVSHHTTITYGKNAEIHFRYGRNDYFINEIKPCLFPLSSMTEDQLNEIRSYNNSIEGKLVGMQGRSVYLIDWLNEHHFDYRGLIEKGLAIDATGLNIY